MFIHTPRLLALLLAAAFAAPPAIAATWPTQQSTIVVAFPAGGNTDIVARYIADALSKNGPKVIVENRTGADGGVGAAYVANTRPDGRTLLFTTNSFVINMSLYKSKPYDALKDFAPVMLLGSYPYVIVVHPSVPAKNFKELIELSKTRPLMLGVNSAGATVATALLQHNLGLEGERIPYRGAGAMVPSLLSGEIQMALTGIANVEQYIKVGTLRPIAVNTEDRSPALPDVPTVNESGLARYSDPTWNGFFAPTGTPPETVAAMHEALTAVVSDPALKTRIEATTLTVAATTPEGFATLVKSDVERWAKLIKDMGIAQQ